MQRTILTALVLLVLAGLLWTFRDSLLPGSTVVPTPTAEQGTEAPDSRSLSAPGAKADPVAKPDSPPERIPVATQEEVQSPTPDKKQSEAPKIQIETVFQKDGKPASQARLHYLTFTDYRRILSETVAPGDDRRIDLFAFVQLHGKEVIADRKGVAEIPCGSRGVCIAGTLDTQIGLALAISRNNVPPMEPTLLELRPARSLRVKVVDSSGKGVTGIPVHVAPGAAKADPSAFGQLVGTSSGPDSLVLVPHFLLFESGGVGIGVFRSKGSAGPFLPGMARLSKAYVFSNTQVLDMSVGLPATGSIRVRQGGAPAKSANAKTVRSLRIRCEQEDQWFSASLDEKSEAFFPRVALGRKYRVWTSSGEQRFDGPVRAGEELLLDLTKKKTGGLSITLMDSQGRAIDPSPYQYRLSDKQGGFKTHSFRIVDRRVIIDAVPVGSQLKLAVSRSMWKQTNNIAGPTEMNEVVKVEVRLPARPSIRLRLLDEQGRAMPETSMDLKILIGSSTRTLRRWGTDKDGVFRYIILDDRNRGKKLTHIQISVEGQGQNWVADRDIDLVIGDHPIDLGDMRLGRPSIALEGIILGDGKPYRGFSKPYLYVERYAGTPETKNPERHWRRVETALCAMGRAGTFTVQGKLGSERHRLGINATKAGYLEHPPIEFRVGQKGLKILLESAASFRAQLELDPPDMAQGLVLKMEQTDAPPGTQQDGYRFYGKGPGGPRSQGRRRPPPRKTAKSRVTWLWESLAPGTYRLTLHCAGYAQPLATFDGIRLKARRLNTDRRLRPYDLRGKVQSVVLTILDAEGKPPQSIGGRPPLVFVGKPREGRPVTAYAIPSSGRVTIAAPQLPVRALVAVRGARLEWIEGISTNRTIRLKAEPTLRLKLRGGSRKLPPGMVLDVDFAAPKILGMDRQADLRVGPFFGPTRDFIPGGGGAVLASDGTGTISLPCVGDYTVSFRIREDRKDWWKGKRAFIQTKAPYHVQVMDLQATQELHLSQESIDATLATLRR